MKCLKYMLFTIMCLMSCSLVFAKGEIVVKSITPIYDENSNIVITDNGVIFNDKDQIVKYNVVLENTTKADITVTGIELSKPTEEFLKYEVSGIKKNEVIKSKGTKEVEVSLETIKMKGWGRNFNDDLTATVILDSPVLNPNTSTKGVVIVLMAMMGITGAIIIIGRKNKITKYAILILMLSSTITITKALYTLNVPITINVQYESQNVMKKAYAIDEDNKTLKDENGNIIFVDYWKYAPQIQNFYIENEFREIKEYVYKFDVSEARNKKVIAYLVEYTGDSVCLDVKSEEEKEVPCYDVYLQADGVIYPNEVASYMFYNMQYLESIDNIEGLDTSDVSYMVNMFRRTGYRNQNFTLDVSNFDTSNVTSMAGMFMETGNSNPNFTLDVSNFNTSNVSHMTNMFYQTGYNSQVFTLDVSEFDTSKVINMKDMFYRTGYNSSNFTLDVSNFDTSKVTNMSNLFNGTGYSNPNFTLDVSGFDTSNVTNMTGMFSRAGYNNPNFTLDVGGFDTSKVTNMNGMFYQTGYSNSNFTLDVSNFDTSKVTNMSGMFNQTGYNSQVFTLDVSGFDTSNVVNMTNMFNQTGYNSTVFTLDVSNFDTSKVTDMSYMFMGIGRNNPNFTLDVSNFDTRNVTNMKYMFYHTGYNSTVFTLDLSNFDTSNVTDMCFMFSGTGFNSENFTLDVSSFDTSKVTSMVDMFYMTGYKSTNFTLDVSNFDTSNVTNMYRMFFQTGYNSTKLNTTITIKNPNVTNYGAMFYNVATKPGSQLTVNYTSETESLVDKMIAAKSDNSNVVKGVQVD